MTKITKDRGARELEFNPERLKNYILRVTGLDDDTYFSKVTSIIQGRESYSASGVIKQLINTALENIDETSPDWTFVASKVYSEALYKEASVNRAYSSKDKYGDYYGLQKVLASKGIYSHHILEKYSRDELREAGDMIVPDRDHLLTYAGIHLLAERYLAKDHEKNIYELPQERWLTIALYLMQNEDRSEEHTSELQSRFDLVCRLLLEKKNKLSQ